MIMNTFLVLLALLGVAVAQAPDTCPAPPKNLLCFIGLKNTCTDSIKCRKGTLCCDDGCRRRCRDPSNDSRGAGQASPRSGTCPSQLSPPPGPCVSDSDECMFDWDCPGSTKKCCSNNCFKECVDPSIGGLRASCPPQKKSISCFINLKNQCSKDSDCSYLPGGLCCFDGCRRRCADSKGFPGRLETDRPGQCPSTKPPRPCISDSDECEFDGDCYPGKKCCDNTCFTRCLDPVGLGTNTSQSGLGPNIGEIIQGEAAGKCPIVSNSTRCHIGLAHTCNNDVECPNGTYCCFDGCRRKCLDTEGNSAGAQGEDKKGLCPVLQRPELCVSDVDECFIDWDCVGDMKCCSNECYKVCTAPALLIGRLVAAAVKCPEPVAYKRCPQSMKHLCDDSKQCPTGTHCCFDGCRRRCISTEPAPDTCPKAGKNLICPVGLRNTCVDKDSCLEGTICCHDGCRRRCRSLPSSTSRPSTKAIPRPGICPPLTPPSEFCPSDYDECKYDWDCDEPSKKCCSNGCYKICASPAVAAVQLQDNCPAPEKPKPCPMTLRNQCFNHTDCSYLSGGLCCYDGCRTRCATAEGFPAQIQKPRPGNCPNLIQPEFCAPHFDECQNDGDCFPVKKCCSNNCFNRCVNPVFGDVGFVNTTSVNKCPDTKKSSTCHVGLKNTCNNDAECANGTYCCFTGCRRQCWDPKTRSSSTLNKKGTCPVLQSPPPPCVSDADECFMDNDCVKDKKCCSNGCYRICLPPSAKAVGSLTTVNCPQPTEYHCATSLKHQCDDTEDCSVDQVCCFDGCRRRCIDYESGQITKGVTVSCRKNEMQIDVERGVLTGFKPIYLRLNNRSCIATGNETHFSLVAPLMGCGTVSSHTGEDVVYSNQVEEEEVEIEGVISRMPELAIPFSCYYTKEGVTSTYGIIPRKLKMTMDGGETKTEFTLEISVFKDENYLLPFGIRDFPLKVSLGKPLFVQLAVDSPDTRLTIREEKCYATPTQNPDDVMQYYIIRQSCVVDSTVKYYPGPQGTRRFSFDTFQFTGEYGGFVYLHCKLVVCNATDPNSRCNVDCFTDFPRRRRRAMEKEKGVARAGLSEGPFVFKSERKGDKESVHSEEESPFNITTIVVVAMAIFCAVCLAVIVYMKVKFVPKPHPDPDRETSL